MALFIRRIARRNTGACEAKRRLRSHAFGVETLEERKVLSTVAAPAVQSDVPAIVGQLSVPTVSVSTPLSTAATVVISGPSQDLSVSMLPISDSPQTLLSTALAAVTLGGASSSASVVPPSSTPSSIPLTVATPSPDLTAPQTALSMAANIVAGPTSSVSAPSVLNQTPTLIQTPDGTTVMAPLINPASPPPTNVEIPITEFASADAPRAVFVFNGASWTVVELAPAQEVVSTHL